MLLALLTLAHAATPTATSDSDIAALVASGELAWCGAALEVAIDDDLSATVSVCDDGVDVASITWDHTHGQLVIIPDGDLWEFTASGDPLGFYGKGNNAAGTFKLEVTAQGQEELHLQLSDDGLELGFKNPGGTVTVRGDDAVSWVSKYTATTDFIDSSTTMALNSTGNEVAIESMELFKVELGGDKAAQVSIDGSDIGTLLIDAELAHLTITDSVIDTATVGDGGTVRSVRTVDSTIWKDGL